MLMALLLASAAGLLALTIDTSDDGDTSDGASPAGGDNTAEDGTSGADSVASNETVESFATEGDDGGEAETEASDTETSNAVTEDGAVRSVAALPGENIVGTDDADSLTGTLREDTISGGEGDDRIEGMAGADLLYGDEGMDTLLGGYGVDVVSGGAGDDLVKGGLGNDFLFGDGDNDTLIGSGGDDVLSGGSGFDRLEGGAGDDVITALDVGGNPGEADLVFGEAGNDRLLGDDGDTLSGGAGVDRFEIVVGGEGQDPVVITDLSLFHEEGAELRTDLVTFLNADGELITRAGLIEADARIEDTEEGNANIIFNDEVIAIIEGFTRDDLLADTNWLGNLSPGLTGRFDGDDLLVGDPDGVATDDFLEGALGDDTLIGGNGADHLDGQQGNDLLVSIDSVDDASVAPDSVGGGDGDDTIRADDGDLVVGQEGTDLFEIVVPDSGDDVPVQVFDFETYTDTGNIEIITLLHADGTPLTAEEVTGNVVIYQSEEGGEALVEYNGSVVAILHGVDSHLLQDQTLWLGNLEPDPDSEGFQSTMQQGPTISMTLETATRTGNMVSEAMFGANAIYSVNTELGVPLDNYVAAVDALDVMHVRFPAGQADPETPEEEGTRWLNVMELEENENGEMVLRPEVVAALDAVIAAHENGADVRLTLSTPTKVFTVEEYEAMYDDMARFAELVVTEYGEAVEAFEIGNEYWIQGETAYGQKADIAARAFAEGMERAGLSQDEQPSIIVQMATPNNGSEFHTSVDDRPFGARRDDANQQIIDQLSDEARDEIDGLVEHYYYNKHYDEFTGDGNERGFIDSDYEIWEQNFDKELDLHITEWNIRTTNYPQNGMRAAGIIAEQFEYMIEMGADAAHAWPPVHNTSTHHAGTRTDMPITDEEGRVLNSVRGAIFDVMSTELVGTELIDAAFSNEDGRVEIQTYANEEKVVFQVVSRNDEVLNLDLDFSTLMPGFDEAYAVRIGYDSSPNSSDGVFRNGDGDIEEAEFTIVDGEPYYFNEFDTLATITDMEISDDEVLLELKPYEVVQITYLFGENDLPPGEAPEPPPGGTITGTNQADLIIGTNGNDSVDALDGNDTVEGGDGSDTLYGNEGNDSLEGGTGDDYVRGNEGDDAIYGFGGADDMKGGDGNDSISGNQGNDTLSGSKGNDLLRGGDGNDTINGGVGTDTVVGGEGRDTLTGWSGTDIFRFAGEDMAAGDLITDFEVGFDVIELDYGDINSLNDLSISDIDGGVVVHVGPHGSLYLAGSMSAAEVRDAANFVFL
ncbi:Ca2+-binding RTX toxin-like protein [Shimia isoporae]|uniref:Ca2+-binding RTX toxin-like protein n=1 Tax=Shimia isoporae TaxID=647720 RepID=A0A4R1NVG1_9RHOB|nr:calcium-binding protein [Shimia isoporae]TCL09062.1 Ca2+-binding RTX toxin-like protein [Shimia isoporae]